MLNRVETNDASRMKCPKCGELVPPSLEMFRAYLDDCAIHDHKDCGGKLDYVEGTKELFHLNVPLVAAGGKYVSMVAKDPRDSNERKVTFEDVIDLVCAEDDQQLVTPITLWWDTPEQWLPRSVDHVPWELPSNQVTLVWTGEVRNSCLV